MEVTQAVERRSTSMRAGPRARGRRRSTRACTGRRPSSRPRSRNLRRSLLLGGVLVAVVLFAVPRAHAAPRSISLTAIPLSLLAAVIVLDAHRRHAQHDDARRARHRDRRGGGRRDHRRREHRAPPARERAARARRARALRVVLEASLEVRSAVVYATFVVVLVFLPVLTLTGLQGSFFAPLALSLHPRDPGVAGGGADGDAGAVPGGLRARRARATHEPRLQRWLKARYRALLGRVSRAAAARDRRRSRCCAASRSPCSRSSAGEFLPEFREGHFVLQVSAAPGTSLAEMHADRDARISEELLALPDDRDRRAADRPRRAGRGHLGPEPQRVPRRARAASAAERRSARPSRDPGACWRASPASSSRC